MCSSDLYEVLVPAMVPGGILVADNAINHQVTLRPMLDRALQDQRVDALIVPIGKGELVCRRTGAGARGADAVATSCAGTSC